MRIRPDIFVFPDILAGVQETCKISDDDIKNFPHCQIKMAVSTGISQIGRCYFDAFEYEIIQFEINVIIQQFIMFNTAQIT